MSYHVLYTENFPELFLNCSDGDAQRRGLDALGCPS